jgi:hypothetical protein
MKAISSSFVVVLVRQAQLNRVPASNSKCGMRRMHGGGRHEEEAQQQQKKKSSEEEEEEMSHAEQDHHAAKEKSRPEINDLFGVSALDIQGDEPCLVQGAKMAGTSFIAGSLFGGVLVYWKDTGVHQRRGRFAALQGTLKTIGSYGGLFALVGATYGTTFCALQHSRTKGDPLNSVMASCAAGGVIGARSTHLPPPAPIAPFHLLGLPPIAPITPAPPRLSPNYGRGPEVRGERGREAWRGACLRALCRVLLAA